MNTIEGEYFLDQDEDCHWYLVPLSIEKTWNKWIELDGDDEASWTAPEGAIPLGTGPQVVIITNPKLRW